MSWRTDRTVEKPLAQTIKNIWQTEFHVSSFLVDANRRLGLYGLLSLMQESAWSHASHLGFGYARTRESGASWVVARQRLEMVRWPVWEEDVIVRTWLRPPGAVLVTRDFEFLVGGETVGQAAAHWLTIDHRTRKPTRIPFPDNPALFRHDGSLTFEPCKLENLNNLHSLTEFEVRHSDLDMNGHVNNVRFSQWVLDALPPNSHSHFQLQSYQVNFLAEARPGDKIEILGPQLSMPKLGEKLPFQGRRRSDGQVLFVTLMAAAP